MSNREVPRGNIRFCAIGRVSDRVLIASQLYFPSGPESAKFLAIGQKILNNDKVLTQKCASVPNAVEDSLCLMQADSDFMFTVFVASNYPERTAFEFLKKVRNEFLAKEGAAAPQATENSLSKSCKPWLSKLCAQYDDLASVNKVAQVQAKVDEVTEVMEKNVKDIVKNAQKVEEMEDLAQEMKDKAQVFKTGAGQLANKMWWQNAKMWVMILVVSFIFLLILVLSICPPCRGGR